VLSLNKCRIQKIKRFGNSLIVIGMYCSLNLVCGHFYRVASCQMAELLFICII
jgi:hypothetical protein